MNRQIEYEKYMKQITDAFIEMQSDDISCSVGNDRDTGFKTVIWNGGLEYKIELNCSLYIKGITAKEAKEWNAKVALQYVNENSLTYDEWFARYN